MTQIQREIKAVLIDCDGTCYDTEAPTTEAWRQIAANRNFTLSTETLSSIVGRSVSDSQRIIVEALGPDCPIEEMTKECDAYLRSQIASHGAAAKTGLDELLDFLESRGVLCAIGSNSDRKWVLDVVGKRVSRVQTIVSVDEVAQPKPEPEIWLTAATRLGVAPENCLVIGDSASDVISASRAGMPCVLVPDCKQPSAEIKNMAASVVKSLHEARKLLEDVI